MEVFDVHKATDNKIILKSELQMETLFKSIQESEPVMLRWIVKAEDEDGNEVTIPHSQILITDGLMARVKDGRFIIKSKEVPKNVSLSEESEEN